MNKYSNNNILEKVIIAITIKVIIIIITVMIVKILVSDSYYAFNILYLLV